MKFTEEFEVCNDGKIQIAQTSKGGHSSWSKVEDSIRLAWYNNGKFDPISSAEIPIWGLKDLMVEALKRDMLAREDLADIAGILVSKLLK
jgi:hypothetical protein